MHWLNGRSVPLVFRHHYGHAAAMRKRSRILFAMTVIALLVVFASQVLRRSEPEPMYQGRSLTHWTKMLYHMGTDPSGMSYWIGEQPIREIGPAAVPFLIKTLRTKDGGLNDIYVSLWP